MDVQELIALRKHLGLSQTEMATGMGMVMRSYQEIEAGKTRLQHRHTLAAERFALSLAIERKDPMLAPASVRKEALELARLLTE
jgi:transcriptional regulator with XRE-family HTH domain